MFSIITIASSTTNPTEIASAISDRLLIEKPAIHMPIHVPASASGTDTPAAMVGVRRRRNRNTTTITSTTVAPSVHSMSSTLARIVPVRSDRMDTSTPAGIHCSSCGNSSFTRSTVSITLASFCLVMMSSTAGWLLNHAADRAFRVASSTSARSDSRTLLPLAVLMMMVRNSAAVRICGLIAMNSLCCAPENMPVGASGLALTIAVRTSSLAIPAAASAPGLKRMRTAGWSAPLTLTCPTPCTCAMRCAMIVSATSYIALGAMVLDVSATISAGAAAGLALRKRGSVGRSVGRLDIAALMAACTSRAARSMLRPISN